jgi:hypothetical protein
MNLIPERSKEIIDKYEQIDTREQLKSACEEIADAISEKQKVRLKMHQSLEILVRDKETIKQEISDLQSKLKELTHTKFPRLEEEDNDNNILEKKLLTNMAGIADVEHKKENEIYQKKENALKLMKQEEESLKATIKELENEYLEMVNWIPSRHDTIQQNMVEQRNAAQERELAQESLILWNSHQLHTAVERELCRLKQEVKRLKNMISHLMKKKKVEDDRVALYEAESKIIMELYDEYKDSELEKDDNTSDFNKNKWVKQVKSLLASIADSDKQQMELYQ